MRWKLFEFKGKQMLIERENNEVRVHLEVDHEFVDVIKITQSFEQDVSDEKFDKHTTQESAEKYYRFIIDRNPEIFNGAAE